MPIYEYHCAPCDQIFSALRRMADYLEPSPCPACGTGAPRIVGAPPRLRALPDGIRRAHEVNERSAHEPRTTQPHQCSSTCGHQLGSSARRPLPARRSRPRPWMLGH